MTPDEIRADMQAGTPGPWQVSGVRMKWRDPVSPQVLQGHAIGPDGDAVCMSFYSDKYHREQWTNARRIARVPELEQAYLDHTAQIAALEAQLADGSFYKETDIDAMQDRIKALEARVRELKAGYADAVSGLDYVRYHYGELHGVGFDRVRDQFDALLAKDKP